MNYIRLYRALDEPGDSEPGTPMVFVASTPGKKRDGKDIDQNRWYLENFRRNPVFLWVHDYWGNKLPLGRAEAYEEGGYLKASVTFDQKDGFARQVEQKYRDRFLHAVSVGWEDIEVEGRSMYDLLDISGVPVPGDPDALKIRQLSSVRGIYRQLQDLLDEEAEPEAEAGQRTVEPDAEVEPAAPSVRALSQALLEEYSVALVSQVNDLILADGERAGAVISKANLADLQQSVTLIQGVIERAMKTEPPPPDEESEAAEGLKLGRSLDEPEPADETGDPEPDPADDEPEDDGDTVGMLTRVAEMLGERSR